MTLSRFGGSYGGGASNLTSPYVPRGRPAANPPVGLPPKAAQTVRGIPEQIPGGQGGASALVQGATAAMQEVPRIAETPLAPFNVLTRGGQRASLTGQDAQHVGGKGLIDNIISAIGSWSPLGPSVSSSGQGTVGPTIGDVVGAAETGMQRGGTFVGSIYNAADIKRLQYIEANHLSLNDPVPVEAFGQHPSRGRNAVPMTVGDYYKHLSDRQFFTSTDPTTGAVTTTTPAAIADKTKNDPLGAFQYGDKKMSENALVEFILRMGTDPTNYVFGLGLIGKVAKASGLTEGLAKVASEVAPWAASPKLVGAATVGELHALHGVGYMEDMVKSGLRATELPSASVAADAIAKGNMAQATLKGLGYALKQVYLPGRGSLGLRYLRGAAIQNLGWQAASGLSGIGSQAFDPTNGQVDPNGNLIHSGFFSSVNDFSQAVLNDHPLSGNQLFAAMTLFNVPVHEAVGSIRATGRAAAPDLFGSMNPSRWAKAFGGQDAGVIESTLHPVKTGKAAEEALYRKLGGAKFDEATGTYDLNTGDVALGKQEFARLVDHVELYQAFQRIKSDPRVVLDAKSFDHLVGSGSPQMEVLREYRDLLKSQGKIGSWKQAIETFKSWGQDHTTSYIGEDGLPKQLSTPGGWAIPDNALLDQWNTYNTGNKLLQEATGPLQGAVLGRAQSMTQEGMDMLVAVSEQAIKDGMIPTDVARTVLIKRPAMFTDPNIPSSVKEYFASLMNQGVAAGKGVHAGAKAFTYDAAEFMDNLQRARDGVVKGSELFHEGAQAEAKAPNDTNMAGPGGPLVKGGVQKVWTKKELDAHQLHSTSEGVQLTKDLKAATDAFRSRWSKRGKPKFDTAPTVAAKTHGTLEPMYQEARKHDTFGSFEHAWQIDMNHGQYWHVTADPQFKIDPAAGGRDMSSMVEGPGKPGTLFVTSDLGAWLDHYGEGRVSVARIDLSAVPAAEMKQINRGFGNEILVDSAKAKVEGVYDKAKAQRLDREYFNKLPQSSEALRKVWDEAHAAAPESAANRLSKVDAVPGSPNPFDHAEQITVSAFRLGMTTAGPVEMRPVADLIPEHPLTGRVSATEVRENGIQVPLKVTPGGRVLDGHNRLAAAKEAGLTEVPVRVQSMKVEAAAPESAANLETMRVNEQAQVDSIKAELARVKKEVLDTRARAEEIGVIPVHETFYDPVTGHPTVPPETLAKIREQSQWVNENMPSHEIKKAPAFYMPWDAGDSAAGAIFTQRTNLGRILFDWGPLAKITQTLDWLTEPVNAGLRRRDIRQMVFSQFMPMGATENEVSVFIGELNRLRNEGPVVGKMKVSTIRYQNSLMPNQIQIAGDHAFGNNPLVMAAIKADKYGGEFYRPLDQASNSMVRKGLQSYMNGQEKNLSGSGILSRVFADGYSAWQRSGSFSAATRMIEKTFYPMLRFYTSVRWQTMNMLENDLIALFQDGIRSTRFAPEANSLTSARAYGVAQAKSYRGQVDPRLTGDAPPGTTGMPSELLNETGAVTAGHFMEPVMRRQFEIRSAADVSKAIDELPLASPEAKWMVDHFGENKGTWSQQLEQMWRDWDTKGVKSTLDAEVAKIRVTDAWTPQEMQVMTPFLLRLGERQSQIYDDIAHIQLGNTDRSRLERALNSYWAYWPLSYQIKSTKWMVDVLTNKMFGRQTNLGGAFLLAHLHDVYTQEMTTNPDFRDMMDNNPTATLLFNMMFPAVPWDQGISLSRIPRYIGGNILHWWPAYAGINNPGDAVSKSLDLGSRYDAELWSRLMKEMGIGQATPTPPTVR